MTPVSRPAAVLLALLLAAVAPPVHAEPAAALQWWGPTEIGQGFHIRIPMTVTNPHAFPVAGGLAMAQVDVGAALRQAGWVSAPSGDRDVLQAFWLDLASIRVVAMVNLLPPKPGSSDGQLRPVDLSFPSSDLRRFEVPSLALPGYLTRPQPEAFHNQTNPIITVVWEVAGTLNKGEQRFFMLYLDTPGNAVHGRPDYSGRAGWGHVQGLLGPGAGLELVGVPVAGNGINTLTVVGLHPGTTVRAYVAAAGGQWRLLEPPQGFPPNPLPMAPNQVTTIYAGSGAPALVRIVADKPILGYGLGTGFVPSLDSGMVGRSFIFAKTSLVTDDTVHFVAAGKEPTTVHVRPLGQDSQPPAVFTMNDAGNPYRYSVGPRGLGVSPNPGCQPFGPLPSPPLASPGLYRAVVVSGGPVSLMHSPNYGLSQAPAADGSPVGDSLWAASGWSNSLLKTRQDGSTYCQVQNRDGGWFASALDSPTNARVTSPEAGAQVDPPGPANDPDAPSRPIPRAPAVTERYPAPLRDRPLHFGANGPIALFVGIDPPVAGQQLPTNNRLPTLHGPLGGADGGRHFASIGPTAVYAPFNNTRVVATLEASRSGVVTQEVFLGARGAKVFGDLAANDLVSGVRIDADRPVIAYPVQPPGTLAAIPPFLAVEPGKAEFRGFLVKVTSPSGLDPLVGSTGPGRPITYTLQVTNLGRQVGGANLPDTVDLTLSQAPPGWRAVLSPSSVGPLGSGETQEVRLTVTPEVSVPPKSLGIFSVQATSRGNPLMRDSLGTVTYLQRSFDVGLWFGDDLTSTSGGKAATRGVDANGTEYSLIVHNRGTVRDLVRLETTRPSEGWRLSLLADGQEVGDLDLAADQKALLRLRVTPPEGATDGVLFTTVTAKSLASPSSAIDRVTATTRIRSPSALHLEVPQEQVYIVPGEEAQFPLTLKNGGGATEVLFSLTADAVPGWRPTGVFVLDPLSGTRLNLTSYSMGATGAGGTLDFRVGVQSPPTAPSGEVLGLRFAARSREGTDVVEAFLYAIVKPVHRLNVTLPNLPLALSPGSNSTTIPVRLANGGNLHEVVAWRSRELPRGWQLHAPAEILVPRNATQGFGLNLTVPPDHPAGTYNVTLDLVSKDGTVTPLALRVAVGSLVRAQTGAGGATLGVQPGRPAILQVPVRNEGNVPLEAHVEPQAAEPWSLALDGLSRFVVPPGTDASVQVAWQVPANAPDGVSRHAARLVLKPVSGEATTKEILATLDVGRADLLLDGVRAHAGPAGTLVEGRVVNAGNRPALAFAVRLLAGQQVVEELAVQNLPPGGSAAIRLLAPPAAGGPLALLADADGEVVESDEANNSEAVLEATVGAPAVGLAVALGALGLALARRKGRRS